MDRKSWMYGRRDTTSYMRGVKEFLDRAVEHMRRTRDVAIFCPCRDCYNSKKSGDIGEVGSHLFSRGFKDDYICWDHHGERFEESGGAGSSRATNVSETFIDRDNSDVGEEIGGGEY